MGRSARSFERGKPKFKPVATVLIVCEDSKSSRYYLESATTHYRINVKVEVSHCGKTDPKGIVEYAISRVPGFDLVFCVIDRDTHKNFDEAAVIAKRYKEKIRTIVSHPCFEFWYVLHFGHATKPYMKTETRSAGDLLAADLRGFEGMADYEKSAKTMFELLLPRLEVARRVSPKILGSAVELGQMNPSSQVHELIDHFEEMEKLEPL